MLFLKKLYNTRYYFKQFVVKLIENYLILKEIFKNIFGKIHICISTFTKYKLNKMNLKKIL